MILSRKDINKLTEFVKIYRANALAFLKYNEEFTGSIAKFVTEEIFYILKDLYLRK
ncbi:MAG: GAD domain-containing protein [Bacilli bacterium]